MITLPEMTPRMRKTKLDDLSQEIQKFAEQRDEAWVQMEEAQREYLNLTGWEMTGPGRYIHEKHPGIHAIEDAYRLEISKRV